VTLRYVVGPSPTPARVAVATSRATGAAVARNRVRRRLRAAVASHRDQLVPGGAYLFRGGREVIEVPFDGLTAAVGTLVRSVRETAS
jgi:ribonuclease P protein component